MKFLTYSLAGETRLGQLGGFDNQQIFPLDLAVQQAQRGVIALIEVQSRGQAISSMLPSSSTPIAIDRVSILAPIPMPVRNIFCVGKNYHAHAEEFSGSGFDSSASLGDIPQAPIIFSKVPQSVVAAGTDIEFSPAISESIDYEAELAMIIGKAGRAISRENALDHVWGYTAINDVTARDWQSRHQQWLLGKSLPTFCPMGPIAVTQDEIDLQNTAVRSYVNGELRQQGNTRDFIFDVPSVIECISSAIPLIPGDIIATGTPAGVGIGFDPPKFLKHGDRVTVEVDGIGKLENSVRRIE